MLAALIARETSLARRIVARALARHGEAAADLPDYSEAQVLGDGSL